MPSTLIGIMLAISKTKDQKLTILLSIASLVFVITGTAGAIPITATLTADNHYALYSGNEQGITFVGANESEWYGNSGTFNWSEAETFDFNVALGDYIYVAAWSDGLVAQGLIGQFDFGCGSILTNTSDWEVYQRGYACVQPGPCTAAPSPRGSAEPEPVRVCAE